MGMTKDQFRGRDIFLDYPFEDVMFRFDHYAKRFYRRFYGDPGEAEVPHNNSLLNDAMRFGKETDAATYGAGKPAAAGATGRSRP